MWLIPWVDDNGAQADAIFEEGRYCDGEREGVWRIVEPDGRILDEHEYQNGLLVY